MEVIYDRFPLDLQKRCKIKQVFFTMMAPLQTWSFSCIRDEDNLLEGDSELLEHERHTLGLLLQVQVLVGEDKDPELALGEHSTRVDNEGQEEGQAAGIVEPVDIDGPLLLLLLCSSELRQVLHDVLVNHGVSARRHRHQHVAA